MNEFTQAAGSFIAAMDLIRRYQQQGYSHEMLKTDNPEGPLLLRFYNAQQETAK